MVPIYLSLILAMLWRAVSRLQIFNRDVEWTWTKLCCSLGALCFVISDSVLSFDLFIYDVPYSHPIIMITYYAAQLGIALSVVDSYESHEVNHLVIQHSDLINGVRMVYKHIKSMINDDNLDLIPLNEKETIELNSQGGKNKDSLMNGANSSSILKEKLN